MLYIFPLFPFMFQETGLDVLKRMVSLPLRRGNLQRTTWSHRSAVDQARWPPPVWRGPWHSQEARYDRRNQGSWWWRYPYGCPLQSPCPQTVQRKQLCVTWGGGGERQEGPQCCSPMFTFIIPLTIIYPNNFCLKHLQFYLYSSFYQTITTWSP